MTPHWGLVRGIVGIIMVAGPWSADRTLGQNGIDLAGFSKLAMEESREISVRRFTFGGIDDGEQFHAIAGGDDHAFGDAGQSSQGAGGLSQLVARNSDALTQFDGRGFVVDPNKSESHGAPNL